jgi:predicted RNA binding protein YcfA (HicA-like mRNA interferase family)
VTRLPPVSGKRVLAALLRGGYIVTHVRGSHHYLRHPEKQGLITVPVHGNRDLPTGTLRAILNQAELDVDNFLELLRR